MVCCTGGEAICKKSCWPLLWQGHHSDWQAGCAGSSLASCVQVAIILCLIFPPAALKVKGTRLGSSRTMMLAAQGHLASHSLRCVNCCHACCVLCHSVLSVTSQAACTVLPPLGCTSQQVSRGGSAYGGTPSLLKLEALNAGLACRLLWTLEQWPASWQGWPSCEPIVWCAINLCCALRSSKAQVLSSMAETQSGIGC